MFAITRDLYVPTAVSDEVSSWYLRNSGRYNSSSADSDGNSQRQNDKDNAVKLELSAEAQSLLADQDSELTPVENNESPSNSNSEQNFTAQSSADGFSKTSAEQEASGEVIDVPATAIASHTATRTPMANTVAQFYNPDLSPAKGSLIRLTA